MPDLKALLEAFVHGGAKYGALREGRQEATRQRATEEEEAARRKERELLEFAVLQQRQAQGQDPTRYATHAGRTYDMRDPKQAKGYAAATATRADDVNWTYDAERGVQIHPRTGQVRRPEGVQPRSRTTDTAGGQGISKLPVTAQSAIVAAQGAKSALDNYKALATDYLGRNPLSRAAGKMGVGGAVGAAGQLESAKYALKLQLKELAALGALSGPDMEIVDEMIGDPTSWRALGRDASYVTSRFDEVQKFINDRVRAYETTYGVKVPGATAAPSRERMGVHGPGVGEAMRRRFEGG